MKFLNKELTVERATELVDELGFLGVCDLVHVIAERTDGSLSLVGHRVTVKFKTRKAGERAEKRWREQQAKEKAKREERVKR